MNEGAQPGACETARTTVVESTVRGPSAMGEESVGLEPSRV